MAFKLLVQMSDYLSPLWNTYLTNEVQLKLFLENYLCGSGCAPVFTFSRSGSAVNLHTLSSASEYIRAAFCMNSEVSPLTKLGRLSGRAEGTFCIFFFFTIIALFGTSSSLRALAGSHSCATVLRLKTKTVSSFSPSGTETWERNSLCCSASTTQKQAELI